MNHNECRKGKSVLVRIPKDLSCTGIAKSRYMLIDNCIAPIVKALQKGKVNMRGSCCGHGDLFGVITLQDERTLIVIPSNLYENKKFTLKLIKLYWKYLATSPKTLGANMDKDERLLVKITIAASAFLMVFLGYVCLVSDKI